jgi:hypothetical protein
MAIISKPLYVYLQRPDDDALLTRIEAAFPLAAAWLTDDWRTMLRARMAANLAVLRGA